MHIQTLQLGVQLVFSHSVHLAHQAFEAIAINRSLETALGSRQQNLNAGSRRASRQDHGIGPKGVFGNKNAGLKQTGNYLVAAQPLVFAESIPQGAGVLQIRHARAETRTARLAFVAALVRYGQFLATTRTAGCQNTAAVSCSHTLTEAVAVFAFTIRRLVRTFGHRFKFSNGLQS